MDENLVLAHVRISEAMESVSEVLNPRMKLTLIARDPEDRECELVVTNDDVLSLIGVIQRSSLRETTKGVPQ